MKNQNFDSRKFAQYKKHDRLLKALVKDGFGVEIIKVVLIVHKLKRCPKTYKFSTINIKVVLTDVFSSFTIDRQKKRIIKSFKNIEEDKPKTKKNAKRN